MIPRERSSGCVASRGATPSVRRSPTPPAPMTGLAANPLWRNTILRTLVYYLLCGGLAIVTREFFPAIGTALGGQSLQDLVGGAASLAIDQQTLPTALAAAVAMLTAFATSLPVAWIYTATRRKRGFQQSVVQTYMILPVVAAGIVIMVKHSLALAFSLAGIVAAVRFRTTLDDSKDAAGIFVVIGIGMAAAVAPSVSWVISLGFNVLMVVLWWTDFGRPPALEGRVAEQRLREALADANRTGTFVTQVDEKILESLNPEQLEAIILRAEAKLKKRKDPRFPSATGVVVGGRRFEHLLRVRVTDAEAARPIIEERCAPLCTELRYIRSETENGMRVLEWGVTLAPTVTLGVLTDALNSIPDSPLRGQEFR